jgi:hypothetical protein
VAVIVVLGHCMDWGSWEASVALARAD